MKLRARALAVSTASSIAVGLACGGSATGEYGGDGGQLGAGRGGAGGAGGGSGARGGSAGQPGGAGPGGAGPGGAPSGGAGPGGAAGGGAGGTAITAGAGGQAGGDGSCADSFALGATTGRAITGTLGPGDNQFDFCPGNGTELHFSWTAPDSGRYVIRTDDSELDTVLFVQSGPTCVEPDSGTCNDDYYDLQSLVAVDVDEGEPLWLVLDSFGSLGGRYAIDIESVGQCPLDRIEADFGASYRVADDFRTDSVVLEPGGVSRCGGGPLGFTLEWRAPVEGHYAFEVEGGTIEFDPVIALRSACGGETYACDDDGGESLFSATTTWPLAEGEAVLIEIGSFHRDPGARGALGPVELSIELL